MNKLSGINTERLNETEQCLFKKAIDRAGKVTSICVKDVNPTDYFVDYVTDGNFIICALQCFGNIYLAAAKRNPIDPGSEEVGKAIAFTRALNQKLGVDNSYSQRHWSRETVM